MTRFKFLLYMLFTAYFWLLSPSAFAVIDEEMSRQLKISDTSLTLYEKTLPRIKSLSKDALEKLLESVSEIKSQANECVDINQKKIDEIGNNSKLLGESTIYEGVDIAIKRKSLNQISLSHENQIATCRLLLLRSTQLAVAIQNAQQKLVASELLTRNRTVLEHLQGNIDKPTEGFHSMVEFVLSTVGLDVIYEHRYLLTMIILSCVLFTLIFRKILTLVVSRHDHDVQRSFARLLAVSLLTCFRHYMLVLLLAVCFAAYFLYLGLTTGQFPFIALVSIGLFLSVLLTFILRVILNPLKPALPLTNLSKPVALILAARLRLLAKILFVSFLIFAASNLHEFPESVTGLLRNIFIALIVFNLCWAFWLLGKIENLSNSHLLRTLIIGSLLISLFADWSGYNNLANFILIGIVGSITAWILTISIVNLWTDFFDSLDDGEFAWQQYFRRKIGVQPGDYLPGSFWFRFTFALVVWSVFVIIFLKIWGLSDQSLFIISDYISNGFDAGPIHIVPSRLIFALLVFAMLLSLVGWIKRRLETNWLNRSRMDRGSKESAITLTGYIGIVIAFLVCLSVAGVELANLALIAGALSVGIGFGLQNVVNNFVSGIVLLFERPIKTGDWIIVGGTQGYVKRIKLRSTMIQTFDRADVIVPNAEIIASQVTNLMLNDSVGRVKVPIRAAYDTDPKLVESILLDIADSHPMVINRSSTIDKPWVLFKEFGESALHFELRCFITDIDHCMGVLSEINYSIAEKFRDAQIEIPFPQADLHVKSNHINELNKTE